MSFGWSLLRDSGLLAQKSPSTPSVVTTNLVLSLTPSSYSGAGSTWDNPYNTTDATMVNTPAFTPNLGFSFNGSNQFGTISSVSNITDFSNGSTYTIEVWCYINASQPDITAPDNSIFEKWNSSNQASYPYVLRFVRATSTVRFALYNGTLNPSTNVVVNTNVWLQLACTFDHVNKVMTMYVNGVSVDSVALNITAFSNNSTVNLARRANSVGGGTNYFAGKIGIVRIYTSILSASQISQNFNSNRGMFGI
jgi:hypothetical protein